MVPNLLRGLVLLIAVLALAMGYKALVRWEESLSEAGGPGVVMGSVERRLHLTLDTRYDTDHRRAFVCTEVHK